MENRICPECSVSNEPEYKYCKNCGATLLSPPKAEPEIVSNPSIAENVPPAAQQAPINNNINTPVNSGFKSYFVYGDYAIDGVPANDIALFVGKKSDKIVPKFIKMNFTNSKISWCWPVAVLGYLLGPIGAALWYFYRKMYKPAIILMIIGAIITIGTSVLEYNANTEVYGDIFNILSEDLTEAELSNVFDFVKKNLPDFILTYLSVVITGLAELVTCIWCGLTAYNSYKNYSIKKIKNFREKIADQRYYRLGISSLGGVSGSMLAVGIILAVAITAIPSLVTAVMTVLKLI